MTPSRLLHIFLLAIGVSGLGSAASSSLALAQTSAPRNGPAIPPLREAGPVPAAGPASSPLAGPAGATLAIPAGILRVVVQRGDVLFDKGGNGIETAKPMPQAVALAVHDELGTRQGSLELLTQAGIHLRLGNDAWVALLSPNSLYLAKGDLSIVYPSGSSATPPTLNVATPCGRSVVQANEARLRTEGTTTVVSVYDGTVALGAPPAGVTVKSGQAGLCVKGQKVDPPRPLLPAVTMASDAGLFLVGDGGSPTEVSLRWPTLEGAPRYRVELYRNEMQGEGTAEVLVSTTDAFPARPQVDLHELEVGNYVARLYAVDENGILGQPSPPHNFVLVRVAGLGPDGTLHTEAGVMPRISGPPGLTWSILLDGAVPSAGAPRPGPHKLRVMIAGLSSDISLIVNGKEAEEAPPPPMAIQGDSESVWIGQMADSPTPQAPPQAPPELAQTGPQPAETASNLPPGQRAPLGPPVVKTPPAPEDLLFGGIGDVPFDGIRSPWAGSYLGARAEATLTGAFRLAAVGRWTMENGFGFDVTANLVRSAFANVPSGQDVADVGNISAAVRTPSLRRGPFILQGIVDMVIPLSPSFLDRSIEQDPQYVNPTLGTTVLRADVRPRGGGWHIEPALLLGIRAGRFAISTMQGLSFWVSPGLAAAYAGGLAIHADIVSALRFVTFANWEVNYLSPQLNYYAQSINGATVPMPFNGSPDAGGAVGGGFEGLIPTGRKGTMRLALLGRVGLGDAGAALYGRGALALQAGYIF